MNQCVEPEVSEDRDTAFGHALATDEWGYMRSAIRSLLHGMIKDDRYALEWSSEDGKHSLNIDKSVARQFGLPEVLKDSHVLGLPIQLAKVLRNAAPINQTEGRPTKPSALVELARAYGTIGTALRGLLFCIVRAQDGSYAFIPGKSAREKAGCQRIEGKQLADIVATATGFVKDGIPATVETVSVTHLPQKSVQPTP